MRCVERSAQRTFQATRGERAQWLKVLEAAYPDKVTDKITKAASDEDFGAWYDLLAGKNGEWRKDEAPTTQMGLLFDSVSQRMQLGPVPSIKRDEFIRFARQALMQAAPANQPVLDFSDESDKVFRVLDRDGDGELHGDELTLTLKEGKGKADADGNGRITKEEYRDYFKAKVTSRVDEFVAKWGGGDPLARPGDAKIGKNGKPLSGGLPSWFVSLDADKDGQIALFEWRDGNKPLAIFQEMDLDGDGLLTRDEYLRYAKMNEDAIKQKKREDGRP